MLGRMDEGEHAASAQRLTFLSVRLALTPPAQGQTITCVITDMGIQRYREKCILFTGKLFLNAMDFAST